MKLKPEELEENGYIPIRTVSFNQLIALILPYLSAYRNKWMIMWYASLLFPVTAIVILVIVLSDLNVWTAFKSFFIFSIWPVLILIPIHEWIHGMAYKVLGAGCVTYGAIWRQGIFYAVADRFVVNFKEFSILAMAPFVVLSLIGIVLLFLVSPAYQLIILGVLFWHNLCCLGDFGLVAYFEDNRHRNMVTYDDVENKETHFFIKEN